VKARNYKKLPSSIQTKKWRSILLSYVGLKQRNQTKLKVLVDSNIWVSGIVFGGAAEDCLVECLDKYNVCVTDTVIDEVLGTLKAKFSPSFRLLKLTRDVLSDLVVDESGEYSKVRDKKDSHVILGALNSGCEIILTGDEDLLKINDPELKVLIINPAEFGEL
jgi:putative PIN family toxin of toxin-antitoxin system